MKNRTLLFVMSVSTPTRDLRATLEQAAPQNARVVCLLLALAPIYPINAYGALPYGALDVPDRWIEEMRSAQTRLKDRADEIEALLQSEGVAGDVQPVQCVSADIREIVARRALVCDLATVAPSLREEDPDMFRAAVHGVLFETPISVLLNAPPLTMPKRIFIGWDTELTAARAIHRALPMLIAADEVVIGCFDPEATAEKDGEDPGADLAKWLSHHGCKVTVNQYPSGGEPIGEAMRRRATDVGADLVVIGAYGHSRMREFVFGGTTRTMLDQTELPVLLAH